MNTSPQLLLHSIPPIKERCEFKILLLIYKCLNGLVSAYLVDMLNKKKKIKKMLNGRPNCGSHRDNDNFPGVPKVNRVTFGGIAFRKEAPKLWNSIPSSLCKSKTDDIFKPGLKTHLFRRALNLH